MKKFIFISLILSLCILTACSYETVIETPDKTMQNASSSTIQDTVLNLISSEDIPTNIMTKGNNPNEVVVFANFPSMDKELERQLTALRVVNQVIRDNRSVTSISIYDDEVSAKEFAKDGTQDITWKGYNHRVAFAYKDESGVEVSYAIGRDDFVDISFGMSLSE